jgi:hypothetical protein
MVRFLRRDKGSKKSFRFLSGKKIDDWPLIGDDTGE